MCLELPRRALAFCHIVHSAVGLKCMAMLISTFFLLKGVMDYLAAGVLLPYAKELGFDGVAYQRAYAVALLPYALKCVVGLCSDWRPLCGYHKKHYMLIACLVGVSCAVGLVVLPSELAASSLAVVSLLFFGIHFQVATLDILCEGVYCKVVQANAAVGAQLVAFVGFLNTAGQMLGLAVVGPVSDAFGTRPLLWCFLPLAAQALLPVSLNFLGERRVSAATESAVPDEAETAAALPAATAPKATLREGEIGAKKSSALSRWREKCVRQRGSRRGILWVTAATALCALLSAAVSLSAASLLSPPFLALTLTLIPLALCLGMPGQLARSACYFFLDRLLHVNITGALNYFFTADEECLPGGPNFDYTYFCTYTAVVGSLAAFFGIFCFQRWFKGWSARSVFCVINLIRVVAAVFDLVIVNRLNTKVGLPDKFVYILGDAIVVQLLLSLIRMTASLTVARQCLPRLEATTYAIISGVQNLGATCSKVLGALATERVGMKMKREPGGPPCDFSGLSLLIVVCNCALPLACLPLALVLLPGEAMNAKAWGRRDRRRQQEEDPASRLGRTPEAAGASDAPDSSPR